MDILKMLDRLDTLRAGDGDELDENWRAWLQGLDAEALKAVQAKMQAFSEQELGITWGGWTEDAIELLSQAPRPLRVLSEAFRAYALALYKGSQAKQAFGGWLAEHFSDRGRPDTP